MPHGDRKREPESEIVVSALKDWSCAEGGGLLTMDDASRTASLSDAGGGD